MLKTRLSVVASGDDYVRTQDGLTYYVNVGEKGSKCGATGEDVVSSSNGNNKGDGACLAIIISTKNSTDAKTTYAAANGEVPTAANQNVLTGYYKFYAGADRVVPTSNTQAVMNATDATAVKSTAT